MDDVQGRRGSGVTEFAVLIGAVCVATAVSYIGAAERVTWWLEAIPVVAGALLLVATRARFPLTPLTMRLLAFHAFVLLLGAHYTYAKVPLGFWAADAFDLARNHYDRFAHVIQGFVPAILAREILLRKTPLRPGGWLFVLVTSVCLAFSAFYELIEWWAAVAGGVAADSFLGAQGDIWDTQWDMFLALLGALAAQLIFARAHDRALICVKP